MIDYLVNNKVPTIQRRECVDIFSKCMEFVLEKNYYKEHWNEFAISHLHYLLNLELDELILEEHMLEKHMSENSSNIIKLTDLANICNETIAVANFAMMIWDKAQKQIVAIRELESNNLKI